MKKQYSAPALKVHGSVESITQMFGRADKNDFLFFPGSTTPAANGNNGPITGDGSVDLRL